MKTRGTLRTAALICVLAMTAAYPACTRSRGAPPAPDSEPSRARAALASLSVENGTAHRLTILYRFANRSAPDVGIGHVDPGALAELAPVPAGEPLLLIARTAAGAEYSTGPRTLPIDGSWTWRIDPSALFSGTHNP